MIARFGRSWAPKQQPFVIRGDGSNHFSRIQGPDDRKNVYEKMLCIPCNTTLTAPFDRAYQKFSDLVLANAATLHGKAEIDFLEIYGPAYVEEGMNLLRYFVKCLGCRIAHADITPPESLREILTHAGRVDTKPLAVTFVIDEFWLRVDPTGGVIGDDCFYNWPTITDRSCFSWIQTLGYLAIFYWYDIAWDNGYLYGGEPMSSPRKSVTLGRRHDPLRDQ